VSQTPPHASGILGRHLFFGHRTSLIRFQPGLTRNSGRRHPPLPCFYPHSEWAASGPVQFGVRSKPRSITTVTDLRLLGLPSKSRSHGPAFKTQSPEQGDGCRYLPNLLDSLPSLTNRWESSSDFGVFPLSLGRLRSRRYRSRQGRAQRLICLSTRPQPVQ
jgi:hypothetical protein